MDKPETKFADAGGVRVAYQVFGSGPRTLVGIPGFAQHLDMVWEMPEPTHFFERLGSICRVIHFDKRGTGLSTRGVPPPDLDARIADVDAVLDAEGVDHAVIGGWSEGASLAAYYAATRPARTAGLVLSGAAASWLRSDDHPWALPEPLMRIRLWLAAQLWGTGLVGALFFAPSMAFKPRFWRWAPRYERAALERDDFADYAWLNMRTDIRGVLSAIRVPTMIVHANRDRLAPVEGGRYLAERIPGARYVEVETRDHALWFGAHDAYCDALQGFMQWHPEHTPDRGRFVTTVLFTDIVESTATATRLGDERWTEMLDEHDRIARATIESHDGRWIKSTGDGVIATFDSPIRAVRSARAFQRRVAETIGVQTRAGLHTGEVELRGGDIAGIAVHQAARIQSLAAPGETLVSDAVRGLLAGAGLVFADRGERRLKGIDAPVRLSAVSETLTRRS